MTTRDALEAALVATPDDVVLHSAYADLLLEQGDPRGEFIRLQLAAEDRNQPVSKLREFEQAAFELRLKHEREWLGDLWQHLQRSPHAVTVAESLEYNVTHSWRRGWIDTIRVSQLSDSLVEALATNPLTRMLGTFVCVRNWREPVTHEEEREQVDLQPLSAAGRFANLRHFDLGSAEERVAAFGWRIDDAVTSMKSLESIRLCVDLFSESALFGGSYPRLHTIDITYNNPRCRFYILGMNDALPNLKRLSLDTVAVMPGRGELGSEREPITPTDLSMFFRSKYLTALEYLTFRNGEFGDEGVEELLASGFINRLKGLDLCRCNITDDGARLLAAHPHVRTLEHLHLDNNLLSPIGIQVLEEAGQPISPNQLFGIAPQDTDLGDEV